MHEIPPPPVTVADFTDVDASEAAALIAYLDRAALLGGNDKRNSYAAQRLGPGMHVLDVGCGTGDDVRAIAAIVGSGGRVSGIDSSRAMVAEARARGIPGNAAFLEASAEAIPFETGTFDACRVERVFHHLPDPGVAAAEVRRVLRPGGTALVIDPDWETLMIGGSDRELTRRIARSLADSLANPWAGRNARGILRRAGFASAIATPVVATLAFAQAYEVVLASAIDRAVGDGVVGPDEGAAWLRGLAEAEARGDFFCGVVSVVAMGTA